MRIRSGDQGAIDGQTLRQTLTIDEDNKMISTISVPIIVIQLQ
jgi:hypothetical protein